MEIKQNLTTVNFNSANKTNKYIVVHYTANSTDTAYNNTKYFKSVNRVASANYFVDDKEIWQCVLDKDIAWHCGGKKLNAGGTYYGKCTNSNSIGIEMCCTNYDVSSKTESNTIELVKSLMSKYGIPASNVIRHYDVTGKNCPKPMVENNTRWTNFKTKLGSSVTPTPSKPSTPTCTGDITYQSYDNIKKQWLPEVVNATNYAGNMTHSMGGIRAKCKNGSIYIQTHIKGGKWLSTIKSSDYAKGSNNGNSYSGIIGKEIDGIKIWSDYGYVSYRVRIKGEGWLPWVKKADNTPNGYAGIYGKVIDCVQME